MLAIGLIANMHPKWPVGGDNPIDFGTFWWWAYGGISVLLVCFAGIMSGLTLGLMSLGLMDLEVLQRSGTTKEKKQAGISSCWLSILLVYALIVL